MIAVIRKAALNVTKFQLLILLSFTLPYEWHTVNTWDSWLSDAGLSTCTMHCRITSRTWTISIFSGASHEEIRSSYKRLALKWHPDKHNNSQEATKVNYKELCIPGNRLNACAMYLSIHCSVLWGVRCEIWQKAS